MFLGTLQFDIVEFCNFNFNIYVTLCFFKKFIIPCWKHFFIRVLARLSCMIFIYVDIIVLCIYLTKTITSMTHYYLFSLILILHDCLAYATYTELYLQIFLLFSYLVKCFLFHTLLLPYCNVYKLFVIMSLYCVSGQSIALHFL